MINRYKSIALSFGYIESKNAAWLIYTAERKLPLSRKEALESLTEHLWKKYSFEKNQKEHYNHIYKTHMAKCCQKYWKNSHHDLIKCPNCGADYNAQPLNEFDIIDWKDSLYRIMNSNCDSYGHYYGDFGDEYGWSPWSFNFSTSPDEMIIINESAEEVLTMILARLHPELKSFVNSDCGGYFTDEYNYKLSDYNSLYESDKDHQHEIDPDIKTIRTIIRYKSGTVIEKENGKIQSIRYANGDQIYYNDDMKPVRVVHWSGDNFIEFNSNPFGESIAGGD
jgi:hypothetical protein